MSTIADIADPIFPPAWLTHPKREQPKLVKTLVEYEAARGDGYGKNAHIEKHKQELVDYKKTIAKRTLNSEVPVYNPKKRDSALPEDIVSCFKDTEAVLNELRRQLAQFKQDNDDLQGQIEDLNKRNGDLEAKVKALKPKKTK